MDELIEKVRNDHQALQMLVKFQVEIDDVVQNQSFGSHASQNQIEERDRRSHLKQDCAKLQLNSFFQRHEFSEDEFMVSLFRLMVTADEIMKLTESDNSFKTMEMSLNKDGVMRRMSLF